MIPWALSVYTNFDSSKPPKSSVTMSFDSFRFAFRRSDTVWTFHAFFGTPYILLYILILQTCTVLQTIKPHESLSILPRAPHPPKNRQPPIGIYNPTTSWTREISDPNVSRPVCPSQRFSWPIPFQLAPVQTPNCGSPDDPGLRA